MIRTATPQDINAIQQIAEQTWPEAYSEILSPEQMRYMLDLFYSEASLLEQMQQKAHHFLLALVKPV